MPGEPSPRRLRGVERDHFAAFGSSANEGGMGDLDVDRAVGSQFRVTSQNLFHLDL